MTPVQAIAMLDRQLARHGRPVTLRRVAAPPSLTSDVDVTLQAFVRGASPSELVGGMEQESSLVIVSPTTLTAEGWPGDGSLPGKLDQVIYGGRTRDVESIETFYFSDVLVRIELRVSG